MHSVHYFVIEASLGEFHVGRNAKNGVVHGRFGSREDAHAHAAKLKRDHLSPAFDKNGNPLTPRERAILGVWNTEEYAALLKRSRKVA